MFTSPNALMTAVFHIILDSCWPVRVDAAFSLFTNAPIWWFHPTLTLVFYVITRSVTNSTVVIVLHFTLPLRIEGSAWRSSLETRILTSLIKGCFHPLIKQGQTTKGPLLIVLFDKGVSDQPISCLTSFLRVVLCSLYLS